MTSARYTARLRVIAEAQSKKVQITNRQGITNKLISSIGCSPSYTPITFTQVKCCSFTPPPPQCYSLPNLDGGLYNLPQNLNIDGGTPSFIGLCQINPSECYNSNLDGGLYNSNPTLNMDGGTPSYIGSCQINPTECYNSDLDGGLHNSNPTLNMDGGTPSYIGVCQINPTECYNSNLDGGLYNSNPTLNMDGGTPSYIGVCQINSTDCYNSNIDGGLYNLPPNLNMDGGTPSFIGLCQINPESNICYNNPVLDGGINSQLPLNFVDARELGVDYICTIDGGNN